MQPVTNDVLNINDDSFARDAAQFLRTMPSIPSGPAALLELIPFIIIIKYLSIVYTLAQSKEKETSKFHKDLLGFLGKGLSRSFSDSKVKRR